MNIEDDIQESQKTIFADSCEDLLEKYKVEKPIIWCDPEIDSSMSSKDFTDKNQFLIYFQNLQLALEFTQKLIKLSIGFVFIDATELDEQDLLQVLIRNEKYSGIRLRNFEEELLFEKLFENSPNLNTCCYKAYTFCTQEEFRNEISDNETEEEVVVMQEINKMAMEFRERVFILYDSKFFPVDRKEFASSLEIDNENIQIYDFDALEKELNNSPDSPYYLILTREDEANKIVWKLGGFKGLLWIYAYFNDSQRLGPLNNKVIKIEGDFQGWIPKIKEKINNMLRLDLPAYMTTSDACDKQRIYNFHLFLKKLKYKNREQAKRDFLALANRVYPRTKDKALISEFEQEYKKYDGKTILLWYTRPSPINKLLNNCLRIATPESIMYARFVLRDLERAILDHFQDNEKFSGELYRSAYLSQEEWENVERNQGQEIEMLGFLSTSKNKSVVEKWIDFNSQNKVLMKFVVPYQLDPPEFADIAKISYYMHEEEVLFNVRSRFQILKTEVRDGIRCVVLLYDPSLSSYLMRGRVKVKYPSDVDRKCQGCLSQDNLFFEYRISRIDCNDCRLKAENAKYIPLEKIFKYENSNTLSSQKQNHGWMCHDCREVAQKIYYKEQNIERGKPSHKRCFECFQTTKERKLDFSLLAVKDPKILIEDDGIFEMATHGFQSCLSIDSDQVNQGDLFLKIEKYKECFEYCQKRLKQILTKRFREQERLRLYDLLGKSSKYLGFGQESKEYLSNNLEMTQFIFGKNHPKTAIAFHNLAVVYMYLKEDMEGVELSKQTVEITKLFYKQESLKTVKALTTLAEMLTLSNKDEEAIQKLDEALKIIQEINGEKKHVNTAKAYHNLSIAYQNLGRYEEANKFFCQALNASISIFRKKAPSKAALYNILADIFHCITKNESLGDSQKFKHLEETKLLLMEGVSQIECQTRNLKEICENLGEMQKGLEWFLEPRDAREFIYAKENKITKIVDTALKNMYQNLKKDHVNHISKSFNEEANVHHFVIDKSQQDQAGYQSDMTTSGESVIIESREDDAMEQELSNYEEEEKRSTECNSLQNDERLGLSRFQERLKMRHENYALLQKSLGKYSKAIQHLGDVLDIIESSDRHYSTETASLHNRLALMHESLQKNEEAEKHHKIALEITESSLCKNPQDRLASYSELALTYEYLGRNSDALKYQNKVLQILESTDPKNLSEIASCYNHIAILNEKLENYKEAQEGYERAGKIMKPICEENHLDIATSYHNIASVKMIFAQFQEAFDLFSKALRLTKAIKGENHPNVATSLLYQARVLRKQSKYREELKNCKKALKILKWVYGEKHPLTANVLNGIAIAYNNSEKISKAEIYQLQALKISNSIHGINHLDIAASYNNLANFYAEQGKSKMALHFSGRALEITKFILGNRHSETASSLSNLASIHAKCQDYENALNYNEEALHITKSIYGKEHPQTALSYQNLALVYEGIKESEKAKDYFNEALSICTSHQECPPSYIAAINRNLGLTCKNLKEFTQAKSCLNEARRIREQYLGKDHPKTKKIDIDLAVVKGDLEEYQSALQSLSEGHQDSIQKILNQAQQSRRKQMKKMGK